MNLATIALFALIAAIPVGTRLLLHQFTPGFHEYETAFLYGSDVLLIAFLLLAIPALKRISWKKEGALRWLALVALAAFISVFLAPSLLLALYSFARLMLLIFFALGVSRIATQRKVFETILLVIALLAVAESVIGFLQFKTQEAVGLRAFGESPISINDPGTSKVAVGSARLVRAYGTFPHPNVLAAFLLMGLLSLFHFYLHTMSARDMCGTAESFLGKNLLRRIAISVGIFVVALGLTLTFSRAAWLSAFLATLPFVFYGFRQSEKAQMPIANIPAIRSSSLRFLAVLLVVNYLLFAILGWAAFPRARLSPDEPAVVYRLSYARLGLNLVAQHPLGVGIGSQVFAGIKNGAYRALGMTQAWQWQPIHNVYLLVAAEIGVIGLLGFLGFLATVLARVLRGAVPLEKVTATTLFAALLLLAFFDHFPWTVTQGGLMLWLTVGIVMGIASSREPSGPP